MQHSQTAPNNYLSPRDRPTGRATRGLAALLAAVLVVLAAGLTSTATAAPSPSGWIRTGHLSPGTPEADVVLTPYSGGQPRRLDTVSFGQLSDYTNVPVGLYTVSLVRAGAAMSSSPMISQNVRVKEGAASTVIATGSGGQVRASVLSDDLTPPPAGRAKIRLISASTDPASVDASVVSGPTLARDVSTGSSTGYADVKAQTWAVKLSGSTGKDSVVRRVPVKAGGVYTLLALNDTQGGLALQAVQDSGSSTSADGTMPTGGVDTGAGGLASRTSPRDGVVKLIALLLGVTAASSALVVLRRRATT